MEGFLRPAAQATPPSIVSDMNAAPGFIVLGFQAAGLAPCEEKRTSGMRGDH